MIRYFESPGGAILLAFVPFVDSVVSPYSSSAVDEGSSRCEIPMLLS
jgi:hypothetical protein